MGGNICSKGTDQCETEVHPCSCSGNQAMQGIEGDEQEKTSPIKIQYDKEDPDKLVDFGAKLETNSKGVHRLVEVEDDGLAQKLQLKDQDIIIELNGTDITDVSHGALLLTLRDIGTKVHFIVNRIDAGSFYQGAVFFRLGTTNDGGNGARIVFKYIEFEEGELHHHGIAFYFVFIELKVLPPEEAVDVLNKYALRGAESISLQFTGQLGDVRNLEILNSGAYFTVNNVKVCMYKYQRIGRPVPGTVTALAAIPDNKPQYGVRTIGTGPGPLDVKIFPPWMKKRRQRITENKFFFLTTASNSNVTISPIAELGLYVTANVNRNYEAEVAISPNGVLKIGNPSNCSQDCIIANMKPACRSDSNEE